MRARASRVILAIEVARASRAPVVAFTDVDCAVGAEWTEAVPAARPCGHAPVTGVIDNGSRTSVTWAATSATFASSIPIALNTDGCRAPGTISARPANLDGVPKRVVGLGTTGPSAVSLHEHQLRGG